MHLGDKFSAAFRCIDLSRYLQPMEHKRTFNPVASSLNDARRLPELPGELLVHHIFAHLSVKDICRLSRVCHRFHTLCDTHRRFLPRYRARLALIRCGRWQDVLGIRRRKVSSTDSTTLCDIAFSMPASHLDTRHQRLLPYRQLIRNFKFDMAFIDVQLLNQDMLDRLDLDNIMANHLLLDLSACPNWPIKRYFNKIVDHLGLNESAQKIEVIFGSKKEFPRQDGEEDGRKSDKRISIAFLQ